MNHLASEMRFVNFIKCHLQGYITTSLPLFPHFLMCTKVLSFSLPPSQQVCVHPIRLFGYSRHHKLLILMEDWHQFKFLPKMKVSACIGKSKGLFGTQHLSSLVHLWQLLGKPRKTNGLSQQPMQQQQHSLKEEMTRTALKNDSHFFSWKRLWPPRKHNTNGMWFLTISFFNVWKEYWILRRGQKPSIGTPRFIEKQIIS